MGLDGHTAGHYLTALAQTCVLTGDPKQRARLQYMLTELKTCQDASSDGFLGGTPGSRKIWDNLKQATFTKGNGLSGAWVPWYNIHKTLAGLRDVWLLLGDETAKSMFLKLSDWSCQVIAPLSEDQMNRMLGEEHGGMNEVLADAFALTREVKYLDAAKRFSHAALLEPLLRKEDRLTGMHANTQIPKVVGFERIGELIQDTDWEKAAEFFWQNVTTKRSIALGGNSVSEHFNPTDNFSSMIQTKEGPETCNTYNMLKLSRMLWKRTGDAKYLDFYERALFNHILSSEHPKGGFVYFTPVRPRHYRVYSEPQESFWCCVGTGLENHTKYGELIYAKEGSDLLVNLFIPSVLNWKEKGLTLTQTGDLSKSDRLRFRFDLRKKTQFAFRMRIPAWTVEKDVKVLVNGTPVEAVVGADRYLLLDRQWKSNDQVELILPMHVSLDYLPDGSNWAAFTCGPWVLAAETDKTDLNGLEAGGSRMGHVANGPLYPIDQAPYFIADQPTASALLKSTPVFLQYGVTDKLRSDHYDHLLLRPFYQIHDARYMIYWNILTPQAYIDVQEKMRKEEAERVELDRRTLDRVTPGEQQPEKDHNLRMDRSQSGIYNDRHWRHAEGWFSYDLKKPTTANCRLRVTYSGDDVNRRFSIRIGDDLLRSVRLAEGHRGSFYSEEYDLPAELLSKQTTNTLTVRFEAETGSIAGGVYDVRIVQP
jgi:DUF1680 family protein